MVSSIIMYQKLFNLTVIVCLQQDGNYTRMLQAILNHPGGITPQSSSYTATYHPSRKVSKLDEPDMQDSAGEVGTSS